MKKLLFLLIAPLFVKAAVNFQDHIPGHSALVTIAEKTYSWNGWSWDLDSTYIFTEGGCPYYDDEFFGSYKVEYSIVSVQWTLEPSYFNEIIISSGSTEISSGEDDDYIWTTGSSGGITVADTAGDDITSNDIEWEIWVPGGSSPVYTKSGTITIADIIAQLGRGLYIIKVGDGSSTTLELSLGILSGAFASPGYTGAGQLIGYSSTSVELEVGKMPGSTHTSNNIIPVNDTDHFVYKATGIPTGQTVQVKISTDSDGADFVDMTESSPNSGIYWSKPLLLVSDSLDDATYSGAGNENQTNDQTHKIKLGQKVKATQLKVNGAVQNVTSEESVATDKTLSVKFHVLVASGTAVASIQDVSAVVETVRERYAQIGVNVTQNGSVSTFTTTVNTADGVSTTERDTIYNDVLSSGTSDFEIILINDFSTGILGTASTSRNAGMVEVQSGNNSVIGEITAHEIGHLLWNDDYSSDSDRDTGSFGHHSFTSNIMYASHNGSVTLNRSRRLTESQESGFQEDVP